MPSRNEFLRAYEAQLKMVHGWANDKSQLTEFITQVEKVLNDWKCFSKHRWNYTAKTVYAAWRGIGGKGRPTLTQLRALLMVDRQAARAA